MKNKFPKTLGLSVITLGVIVLMAVGIIFCFSPEQRLRRLGYSADEVKSFTTLLNQNTIREVLGREYNASYPILLEEEDFLADNFVKYLDALAQNNLDPSQTVALVNHPDYEAGKTYSALMLEIMQEENYLSSRRERYFNLSSQESHITMNPRAIVSLVNADRDYEFYTKTVPANPEDGTLILVNKYYYLDESYVPDLVVMNASYGAVGVQVEREAYSALIEMANTALLNNIQLYVTSGYRSYTEQAEVYDSWVQSVGEDQAVNYAALPGYSEHQTGLALDIFALGETTKTFANCATAKWLAEHAAEFGFILRYSEGSEDLTGYDYEAWHFRYVGVEAATDIVSRQLTLEEYWAIQREN